MDMEVRMSKAFKHGLCLVLAGLGAYVFIAFHSQQAMAQKDLFAASMPDRSYFEALGEIIDWVPLPGDDGYEPGCAKGAAIRFRRDFHLSPEQKMAPKWNIHKDERGCEEGETTCETCPAGDVCTLWIPTSSKRYFEVDMPEGMPPRKKPCVEIGIR
jgi:hypothetical protein